MKEFKKQLLTTWNKNHWKEWGGKQYLVYTITRILAVSGKGKVQWSSRWQLGVVR